MSKYDEHLLFLRKMKKKKFIIMSCQISILFVFLFLWEVLSDISILNSFLYSSPSKIINTIFSLFENGTLFSHIFITLSEVCASFILSTILGIFIAFILWRFDILAKIVEPYITIFNSLPKVALGPLIIIWMGASIHSIIFMALTISIFTTILTIYQGFISVPHNYIVLLKSFGASPLQIFFKLILPFNFELIISSLKINIALSLIGVIMGELLVSKKGLGYLIMYGSQVFQLDLVISSIFILGILSYLLYYFIDKLLSILQKKKI